MNGSLTNAENSVGSPSLMKTGRPKKVAIIGAGLSGIISGSVLKEDGHDVTLFERSPAVGGVWSDVYPEAKLQNVWKQYCNPDFPIPRYHKDSGKEIDDYYQPTGDELFQYWKDCADNFELKVKLNTTVVGMEEIQDSSDDGNAENSSGWIVTFQSKSENDEDRDPETEQFDFVVVAQGHYTRNDIELPWKGVETFEKAGGKIFTRNTIRDLEQFKDKKVVIIGFGKTAVDMSTFAVEHGAASTTLCFRNPRAMLPVRLGGVHNAWLNFNRCNNNMVPSWGYAGTMIDTLHHAFPLLLLTFWSVLAQVVWIVQTRCAWFASREARARVEMLRSKTPLLQEVRTATGMCPENLFPYVVQGKIFPFRGEVERMTAKGLLVRRKADDGTTFLEEVEADIIVACIGNSNQAATFPYLPAKYQAPLTKDDRGLQLYRHVISPNVKNLAFMGWNYGFLHCTHVYLASVWLSTLLHEEMQLPSTHDQQERVARIAAWKRTNIIYEPDLNAGISSRLFAYNDTLMLDLGLNPHRKPNPVAESLEWYSAEDYRGVLREVQVRRQGANGKMRLTPIPVDM